MQTAKLAAAIAVAGATLTLAPATYAQTTPAPEPLTSTALILDEADVLNDTALTKQINALGPSNGKRFAVTTTDAPDVTGTGDAFRESLRKHLDAVDAPFILGSRGYSTVHGGEEARPARFA